MRSKQQAKAQKIDLNKPNVKEHASFTIENFFERRVRMQIEAPSLHNVEFIPTSKTPKPEVKENYS